MKLDIFLKIIKDNGRKMISIINEEEFSTKNKYVFSCVENHVVNQRASDLIQKIKLNRKSKGCLECHKKELEKHSLEVTVKHVPENFKLIGSYRKNVNQKQMKTLRFYKFQCPNGHFFEKDSGHIKNLTCPKCSEKFYVGQERTRKIFQELFQEKFISVRPDWLRNPATGKNLELDGYCESLNIAFEFQGRQHSSDNTQYKDDYNKQQERDKIKKSICEERGVCLIEINQPDSYSVEGFTKSVVEQIKSKIDVEKYKNIDFNIDIKKFNFVDLNYKRLLPNVELFFNFCKEDAPVLGYSCLSAEFQTYEDKIDMLCPEGHQFTTTAAEFKRNILGKKGRNIPCVTCYAKTNAVKTKIDL